MAQMKIQLPTDIIEELEKLNKNASTMIGEMTQAGAKVVYQNIVNNVPPSFHNSGIMECLKLTRIYTTPSDGGVNTKVAFYGYFLNSKGQKVPAPLVCNVFEYGTSKRIFPQHKFLKKSFNKKQIEDAMKKAQEKYIEKG